MSPALAHDTDGTVRDARMLHTRIAQPNLLVKIPATKEGVPAINTMISEGRSINVTLIFGIDRYDDVIEAYISGIEALVKAGRTEELPHVASVGLVLREPGRHRGGPAPRDVGRGRNG